MPVAYSEAPTVRALAYLSTFGSAATVTQANANRVTSTTKRSTTGSKVLTGSFQNLFVLSENSAPSQTITITGFIAGEVTSSGLSGTVTMQFLIDGVVIGVAVSQSFPTDASGVNVSWSVSVQPAPGLHTYEMQALVSGDGAVTIPTGAATIQIDISN